jgi:hypothetical protein
MHVRNYTGMFAISERARHVCHNGLVRTGRSVATGIIVSRCYMEEIAANIFLARFYMFDVLLWYPEVILHNRVLLIWKHFTEHDKNKLSLRLYNIALHDS